jgi:murein DD-endopeptidase MepM/ murein hydrolase activator NlpD
MSTRHIVTAGLVGAAVLSGCEIVDSKSAAAKKPDSAATSRAVVAESARGAVATDSTATTAVPNSSAVTAVDSNNTGATTDTTLLQTYPPEPRRGGVVFALAGGTPEASPHCTWKGAPIPCYGTSEGIVLTIPLPADEDAGQFTLTIDRPSGRIVRQITVADHDFGRELIFLPDSLYKRATSTREIARDARAVRGIASVESPDRRWTGRWREPVAGMRSTAYGVERYYYRATDSTRSISLDSQAKTRGTFAGDTSDAPFTGAPSWRHSGIDIPAKRGTTVAAPAAGVVADVGNYILSGRTVLIDHGQGVVSAYFHLDTATVSKGDIVRVGQRIGRVGSTGLATGPHLHFTVYVHGKDVDPVAWRDMPQWLIAQGDTAAAREKR